MGLSCHVEPIARGRLTEQRAGEIAARVTTACQRLDWQGGETLVVRAEDLLEGRTISTKLARDADADVALEVMRQCVGAALLLSRELPEWRWVVSDDLESEAHEIADAAVVGDAELTASVWEELEADSGPEPEPEGDDEADDDEDDDDEQPPDPSLPALGTFWITRPGREGAKRSLHYAVELRNPRDTPVDAQVTISLYDPESELLIITGRRTLGGQAKDRLAPRETRTLTHDDEVRFQDRVERAGVRIRYLEHVTVPVELVQVDGAWGRHEVRTDAVVSPTAPFRSATGTLAVARPYSEKQQPLELHVDVASALPFQVSPNLRFYNAAGGIIRQAYADSVERKAGTHRLRFDLQVRPAEKVARISCELEAALVLETETGRLTIRTRR
jgi:hypothetical protein